MMTRIPKPDVSETDVSQKKMNIQKKPHRYLAKPEKIARSYKGCLYAMTTLCRVFRSDGWRYCGGSIPSKSCRPTPAVMNIYVHRPTDATQQRRLGANIFHGEQYWQGIFSLDYIAIIYKLFMNYIECLSRNL